MHEISVIVATYNPDLEKTIDTLESITCQKNIDFEIVLADDGSEENYFSELQNYFKEKNFVNYKFVALEENQGTVNNLANGIAACDSDVVKCISPGDMLADEYVLYRWFNYMKMHGCKWSFGDCVYYHTDNDTVIEDKELRHPFVLQPYIKGQKFICRRNYTVFADNANGASTICNKELAVQYVNLIKGKIKFAEDNMYRLMMYDNIVPCYFAETVVLYENGTGVSTSGSDKWRTILSDEWNLASKMIIKSKVTDFGQIRLKMGLIIIEKTGFIGKIIRLLWHKLHTNRKAYTTGLVD